MPWYSEHMLMEIMEEADAETAESASEDIVTKRRPRARGYGRIVRQVPLLSQMFIRTVTSASPLMRYVVAQRFDPALGGDVMATMSCSSYPAGRAGEVDFEKPLEDRRLFWFPVARPKPFALLTTQITATCREPRKIHSALGKVVDPALADALLPRQRPARVVSIDNG